MMWKRNLTLQKSDHSLIDALGLNYAENYLLMPIISMEMEDPCKETIRFCVRDVFRLFTGQLVFEKETRFLCID